jgi:hypothetical protein
MDSMVNSWQDKWQECRDIIEETDMSIRRMSDGTKGSGAGVIVESHLPHLVSMSDDRFSSGIMIYNLKVNMVLLRLVWDQVFFRTIPMFPKITVVKEILHSYDFLPILHSSEQWDSPFSVQPSETSVQCQKKKKKARKTFPNTRK